MLQLLYIRIGFIEIYISTGQIRLYCPTQFTLLWIRNIFVTITVLQVTFHLYRVVKYSSQRQRKTQILKELYNPQYSTERALKISLAQMKVIHIFPDTYNSLLLNVHSFEIIFI